MKTEQQEQAEAILAGFRDKLAGAEIDALERIAQGPDQVAIALLEDELKDAKDDLAEAESDLRSAEDALDDAQSEVDRIRKEIRQAQDAAEPDLQTLSRLATEFATTFQ